MSAPAASDRPRWGAVALLGIGQILNWGTLYYVIAVLGAQIAADMHLSGPAVFAGFSIGLGVSGVIAPRVGRLIDERGGRLVLATGSLLAAAAFTILATGTTPGWYYLGWIVAGCAMAFALYDPAFATVQQLMPRDFRRALTALTLLGGLASTVFWPLIHALDEAFGWRVTLAVCAGLHLLVGWPLHRFGLPAYQRPLARAETTAGATVASPSARGVRGFVLLAMAFSLTQLIASGMAAHVINLLVAGGISGSGAVWLATLIGPMQVVGRIVEFGVAGRVRATVMGGFCFVLLFAGLSLLASAGSSGVLAVMAMIVYGWGNGTVTIARGTVPAELYGRDQYGALLGRLARPQFIARATAPFVVALALNEGSPRVAHMVLVGAALLAAIAYALALARIRTAVAVA